MFKKKPFIQGKLLAFSNAMRRVPFSTNLISQVCLAAKIHFFLISVLEYLRNMETPFPPPSLNDFLLPIKTRTPPTPPQTGSKTVPLSPPKQSESEKRER